ncbi:unnamed protein product [Cyprideis torosa]|uniref:Phosphatidylcholine transfer protein n=1 Tax=Cyprideis torosa TaxID=163714 RepID=A0A7R8ZMD6_9CRUS|nr:unnamed protein product [Cyprideis torosa]CAG0885562.1 unnamed protein product [Cyprideis torosa]
MQYNLTNPKASDFSQNGQSAVVAQLLGQKTGGFFVEAGAYNGEDLSNTLYFERELNWTGLLVEPDPWNYYALKKRRRKAYSMGACLSSNRQIREVRFKQSDTMGKVVPENFPGKGIFTHQTCFPLHVLLLALEQNHVDFLSLDVEGLEEEPYFSNSRRLQGTQNTKLRPFRVEGRGGSSGRGGSKGGGSSYYWTVGVSRGWLICAVAFSKPRADDHHPEEVDLFDWDLERITEKELNLYDQELEVAKDLLWRTLSCKRCGNRVPFDQKLSWMKYCSCQSPSSSPTVGSLLPAHSMRGVSKKRQEYEGEGEWEAIMERHDLILWRRLRQDGLYEYRSYGRYEDVSANSFLRAHMDLGFRTKWDETTLDIHVIDKDKSSDSVVIYWLSKFPYPMYNRDFVFKRSHRVSDDGRTVVVLSKITTHPNAPLKRENHRVQEYQSVLNVRPFRRFDEPGLEYTFQYVDNPGSNLPGFFVSYVAYKGFPTFIEKAHQRYDVLDALTPPMGSRRP